MKRSVRDNSLSLFFLAIFALALLGQSIAGYNLYNQDAAEHGEPMISYARYLISSDFGADTLENWQSEWLQFWLFALATVWLVQRGSNESKAPEEAGLESDQKQKVKGYAPENAPRLAKVDDWRHVIFSYSFTIVMGTIFLATWLAQSFASWTVYNDDQAAHDQPILGDVCHLVGLLGAKPSELAVGIPGRRDDGGLHDLPPPAWVAGVEARGGAARRNRQFRLR